MYLADSAQVMNSQAALAYQTPDKAHAKLCGGDVDQSSVAAFLCTFGNSIQLS